LRQYFRIAILEPPDILPLRRFSRFSAHSYVKAKSLNLDINRPSLQSLEIASKTMKREVMNVAHAMKKGLSTPI